MNEEIKYFSLEFDYDCVIDITKFTDISENGWGIDFPNQSIQKRLLACKKGFVYI